MGRQGEQKKEKKRARKETYRATYIPTTTISLPKSCQTQIAAPHTWVGPSSHIRAGGNKVNRLEMTNPFLRLWKKKKERGERGKTSGPKVQTLQFFLLVLDSIINSLLLLRVFLTVGRYGPPRRRADEIRRERSKKEEEKKGQGADSSAIPFERKKSIQAPVIELSDSFKKKGRERERDGRNDGLPLYSLRLSISLLAREYKGKEKGNHPNLQINTSNRRKCRV